MVFVKTHDIAELATELIGKQVVLGGWIEDLRKLGKMSFITLRDVSGISQIIVKGELNDNLGEINRQSVVSVKGIVQETKARDFSFEVKAEDRSFRKSNSSTSSRPNWQIGKQYRYKTKSSCTRYEKSKNSFNFQTKTSCIAIIT